MIQVDTFNPLKIPIIFEDKSTGY